MSDRLKMPPEHDFGFYQRRKHDKWRAVAPPAPPLEAPVADSHAHVHMLPDPAWELARCAANGVDYVCVITDPSDDGPRTFDELDAWQAGAAAALRDASGTPGARGASGLPAGAAAGEVECQSPERAGDGELAESCGATEAPADAVWAVGEIREAGSEAMPFEQHGGGGCSASCPEVRIAVGVHPHNAKLYCEAIEKELVARLGDARVVALGEVGLDYHYDLSPRDVQRRVFRRQVALAKEHELPIALHLRGGEDPQADNAHREAFELLCEEGLPERGVLLHCCSLAPDELRPWVDAGCYIAYGGALTFKNGNAARAGARLVPADRLLLETDSPYMAPEPMRGAACTPAHIVFTAAALAEVRGVRPGGERQAFLQQVYENTLEFYRPRTGHLGEQDGLVIPRMLR